MNIKKSANIGHLFRQYKVSIIDSGFASANSEWNASYVCSPFSRLYYVSEGEAYIKLKDRTVNLLPGNMYLIPLGTKYSCECKAKFNHLYFHINIDSPNGYDLLRGASLISSEVPTEKILRLTELYFNSDICSQLELQHEIYRSLFVAIKLQPSYPDTEIRLSPDIAKAVAYIKANLSLRLTAEEIAEKLYMSKNTLNKQFKREVGIPIGKYIDKLIFFEAEKLLSKSSLSIKEIGNLLGFCDSFYFSRRFKQLFEETPASYRKRVRSFST